MPDAASHSFSRIFFSKIFRHRTSDSTKTAKNIARSHERIVLAICGAKFKAANVSAPSLEKLCEGAIPRADPSVRHANVQMHSIAPGDNTQGWRRRIMGHGAPDLECMRERLISAGMVQSLSHDGTVFLHFSLLRPTAHHDYRFTKALVSRLAPDLLCKGSAIKFDLVDLAD